MTNPLIPYSFVPGTKAKAQEVNANFISLAEEITDNKSYFDGQIASLSDANTSTNTDLEATNAEVAKKLGYQNLTNCIIAAPNGIAEHTGNTLTVKNGLKVLIPDGVNEDGSYKNIEYTLEADVSIDLTGLSSGQHYFYISSDGTIFTNAILGTFEQYGDPVNYTASTTNYLWLDKEANKYKYSTDKGANWSEKSLCKLGIVFHTGSAISQVNLYANIELMKMSSVSEYITLMMPDFSKVINHGAGTFYRNTNGWLRIHTWHNGQALNVDLNINGISVFNKSENYAAYSWFDNYFVPIPRGSKYTLSISSGGMGCQYFPAKGG